MYHQDTDQITRYNTLFTYYSQVRKPWEERGLEYEMLARNNVDGTGTQYTKEQLLDIRKRYGIPLSINILHALKEQCQAFLTGLKPSIGVVPVGDSAKNACYIWRELITAVQELSDFRVHSEMGISDTLDVGHGVFIMKENDFYNHNSFNVNIKRIPWHWVYIDPNSKDPHYQDAELIFVAYPIPKSKAKKLYNLTDEEMQLANSNIGGKAYNIKDIFGGNGLSGDYIWLFDIYEKIKLPTYILADGKKVYEKPLVNSYIDASGKIQNLIVKETQEVVVKRVFKVGNYIYGEEVMPIKNYPLFFYSFAYNGSPRPESLAHHVVDIQKMVNKLLALIIEITQKSTGSGTFNAQGTIINQEEYETSMSTPGASTPFIPDSTLSNDGAPIQKQPYQTPNNVIVLWERLIKLMEYITGIFDLMQGNAENAPQTLGATQSLQNFGSQRPKMYVRHMDDTHKIMFETFIQFYQKYAPPENTINYLSGTNTMVSIKTNVQAKNQEQIQAYIKQMQQQGQQVSESDLNNMVASFVDNEAKKEVMSYVGDLSVGEYLVRFQSTSDMPNTQSQVIGFLQTLLSRTSNDAYGMAIVKMMLTIANYPEVDKILQDVDVIGQLQQEVAQLQQQVEAANKAGQQLQAEAENSEIKARDSKLDANMQVAKAKIDLALKDINSQNKELQTQKKKVENFK